MYTRTTPCRHYARHLPCGRGTRCYIGRSSVGPADPRGSAARSRHGRRSRGDCPGLPRQGWVSSRWTDTRRRPVTARPDSRGHDGGYGPSRAAATP